MLSRPTDVRREGTTASVVLYIAFLSLLTCTSASSRHPFECKVTARIGCFLDVGKHADKRKRVLEEQVDRYIPL